MQIRERTLEFLKEENDPLPKRAGCVQIFTMKMTIVPARLSNKGAAITPDKLVDV